MTYGLSPDYIARTTPQYFNDTLQDSHLWQADIYRVAAKLADRAGIKRIVDIGCGRALKLGALSNDFPTVGIDYGANIEYCEATYPAAEWITADLEVERVKPAVFKNAVVICADVIEHIINPDALIETLHNASETAAYVLISTPDRQRLYRDPLHSPPDNESHVREWSLAELEAWFTTEGLPVRWTGWTIS